MELHLFCFPIYPLNKRAETDLYNMQDGGGETELGIR